ncbi:hypothetical protein [Halosimplex sp. J119]
MRTLRTLATRPGIVFGVICGAVGLGLQGPEGAVIWLLVGFFVGKSLQSTLWTLSGETTS